MLKVANVIKRMEANGIKVEKVETVCEWGTQVKYYATTENMVGEFYDNGNGETGNVYTHRKGKHDDLQSDYFCGSFANTIKQAIDWMLH